MTCLSVPNRLVQPKESWEARLPIILQRSTGKGNKQALEMFLTCTFEGCRPYQGQNQALITLAGAIRGRDPLSSPVGGKVEGKVHFSVDKGFLTQANLKSHSESSGVEFGGSHIQEVVLLRDAEIGRAHV